ncbi:glycoside hydrolase family 65 central catalytic [Desulfurivibrio alkaliphilus AHT 2]|uniref:Glycoside hydrolase family 65 central catalytic n=1 Tax=Desulfurivibrio alkaliphilus (strain DSM 19089 / UNIQEM U267 / AHT2) TaxID=589865 RepID=D6Z5X2_DESAT|nr:glycosyl hydrolase family 65 protein [Desulfurivibrio alkaliphilus]ADH84854.1 glycoside hydrolase family 65 central catalytic [Desulfurivibrio alkaliphilus AHT 2]
MDSWRFVYEDYQPDQEGLREALCTLGNGYFATRGAAPDSAADGVHYPGTYLAGGYNRLKTKIAGREVENEDLVNLPNWLPLTFRIDDGEWFRIDQVEILSCRQELDLKSGLLHRDLRFRDGQGRTTRWRERRLVSMADPHLAGLAVELRAEDWSGRLTVRSALDGSVTNSGVERYRDLANQHLETLELDHPDPDTMFLRVRTNQSLIQVAQAARTRLYRDGTELDAQRRHQADRDRISQEITMPLSAGEGVVVEKILALYCSLDQAISEPGLAARHALSAAGRFDDLLTAHALVWKHLWEDGDIRLEEQTRGESGLKLRVHIFHLLQTVSFHTADRDVGVPARGWHGEAYRGHIFWDELFIFPFLTLRMPVLTRALLRYRYRRLPEARRAAQEAGYAGAMYPWQSGSTGREETQRLHLNPHSGRWLPDNSQRQHHINAAIAYNIWSYCQATDDHEFLYYYGAEMLLEIARFWASIATHNEALDRYEIKGVMGPDEYHTAYPDRDPEAEGGLDNNAYTNIMAAWVLSRALDVLEMLPKFHGHMLCERIGLRPEEVELWHEISRKIRVPFHDGGIISQFEGYGDLKEFDWTGYKKKYGDIQRLDRILEAEEDTPNRYKVSKQADVLMLFYLFSADELKLLFEQLGYPFAYDTIPRNVDYYLARTSHGSTLSQIAHSWVLARSDRAGSWDLFQRALDSDIADIQGGTTPEGIHVGAMAGTIDLVQRCYLGIEMRANILHFDPSLPADLGCLKVRLRYRRQILAVEADHDLLKISSCAFTANLVTVAYRGRFHQVAPGDSCQFRLLKPGERDRDENRARQGKTVLP